MKAPIRFQQNQITILPILLTGISIFVGIFFTYGAYSDSLEKVGNLEALQTKTEESGKLLERYNHFKTSADTDRTEVQKYIGDMREDKILESVFALSGTGISIGSVSIDPGEKLTSGLTLAGVNVSVDAQTTEDLLAFFDRATTDAGSNRRFLIKAVSFPYDSTASLPVTASVQLGMYTIK